MKLIKILPLFLSASLLCACASDIKPRIVQNSPRPEASAAESSVKSDEPVFAADYERYQPLNYDVQKAVWISYIELADMLADSEQEFRSSLDEAYKNVSDLGCNTVYVHVRAFGDAYYSSSLYTVSKYVSTENGTLRYDPLKIMTELAHEHELSFHAWINPMRCDTDEYMQKMQGTQIYEWYSDSDKYPDYVSRPEGDDYYWLNPSRSEVRELIADGVVEIAENYDVDGIHIDDYFYPTTAESFDGQAYIEASADISLADWRLENCSEMVKSIYEAVKSVDDDIIFGISPQGNVDNNYSQMYADVEKWCAESGYLDYIAPQIYFGYNNDVCPFTQTLERWESIVTNKEIKLVCGLGVYKLDRENEFIRNDGIIASQIEDVLSDGNCSGFALYSYASLFTQGDRSGGRFERETQAIYSALN